MPIPYSGRFTIELWRGASLKHVPQIDGVVIDGNIIQVASGRIASIGFGGIQFYVESESFAWGYEYIRHILDADGKCIWHNREAAMPHQPGHFFVEYPLPSDKDRLSLTIKHGGASFVMRDMWWDSAHDLIILISRIAGGHIVVDRS